MDDRGSRGFEPDDLERRGFLKTAGFGMLAFTVGGSEIMMTPARARAENVPFRSLTSDEVKAVEALGETLVPGAREAGLSHFIDQQVSGPPEAALLEARIVNVRPPYLNFYRAALIALDKAGTAAHQKPFAQMASQDQVALVDLLRQNKIEGWQSAPPQPLVYFVLRSDAADVVYGTVEGYAALGMPYQPHIAPEQKW